MKPLIWCTLLAFWLVACHADRGLFRPTAAGPAASPLAPVTPTAYPTAPLYPPPYGPAPQPCTAEPCPAGRITFPSRFADAGNFVIQAGATITLTWVDPPVGAVRYEFSLQSSPAQRHQRPAHLLGADTDPTDGVAIAWAVPEAVSGDLRGAAYFGAGPVRYSDWSGTLYSGQAPPAGRCTLSVHTLGEGVRLYQAPDQQARPLGVLPPAVYAAVLAQTPDGWYQVETRVARGVEPTSTSATGWVPDQGVALHGDCTALPHLDYWEAQPQARPTPAPLRPQG